MKNQIYPLFCVKHTYNKFVVTNFDTKNARRRLQSDKGVNMHTYTMTMNTYIIPNTLSWRDVYVSQDVSVKDTSRGFVT